MQEELDEPDDFDLSEVGGTKKQFLSKSLALWKQQRFVGSPTVLGAGPETSELDLITQHWQPLFESVVLSHRDQWARYLPWLPQFAWPAIPLDVGLMASLLGSLPKTACGPDGISYAMLASIP
eukprot:6488599-Amphidinium_carterae.1